MEKFTKDILQTGMRVKLRDGSKFLVMKDYKTLLYGKQDIVFLQFGSHSFDIGDNYDDNLKHKRDSWYDIIEVAVALSDTQVLDINSWNTIWKREDKIQLSTLNAGDEFKIGDEIFIVLEKNWSEVQVKVIRKDFLYKNTKFGISSDWKTSDIRSKLNNDYYKKIANLVGENNIFKIDRNLTSLDGLDDYGTCVDKISLLSASEYAKYHKILGLKSNYSNGWWTITPASTPNNEYSRYVCCVRDSGILGWNGCDNCYGVRPFCILNSSILVDKL